MKWICWKLNTLYTRVNEVELEEWFSQEFYKYFPKDDIREQLYRYSLYFITAHEYGHILNGDCEPGSLEQPDKEMKADKKAKQLIEFLCGVQAKYHDHLYPETSIFNNLAIDHIMFSKAIMIADELRKENNG